jgi:hypothetical protein
MKEREELILVLIPLLKCNAMYPEELGYNKAIITILQVLAKQIEIKKSTNV